LSFSGAELHSSVCGISGQRCSNVFFRGRAVIIFPISERNCGHLSVVCRGTRQPSPGRRIDTFAYILSIYLSGFLNSCRRLPETKRHSSLFFHCSDPKLLVVMAACTPSIHVFLGRPLFLLFRDIESIINFGILSSGILLTWPYHCSLFCSMMSGFPFTPIISFISSFFTLSVLDFLADLLSTSVSVDKISYYNAYYTYLKKKR